VQDTATTLNVSKNKVANHLKAMGLVTKCDERAPHWLSEKI
jgi:hypothetical protein